MDHCLQVMTEPRVGVSEELGRREEAKGAGRKGAEEGGRGFAEMETRMREQIRQLHVSACSP